MRCMTAIVKQLFAYYPYLSEYNNCHQLIDNKTNAVLVPQN